MGQILSWNKSLLPQWCHLSDLFTQSQILPHAVPIGLGLFSFCGHRFSWMQWRWGSLEWVKINFVKSEWFSLCSLHFIKKGVTLWILVSSEPFPWIPLRSLGTFPFPKYFCWALDDLMDVVLDFNPIQKGHPRAQHWQGSDGSTPHFLHSSEGCAQQFWECLNVPCDFSSGLLLENLPV